MIKINICIDLETTGLDIYDDEILQISIIDENEKTLINEYIKPNNKKSWLQAEIINRISPEKIKHCKHFSYFINDVKKIINNADLIIGFNHKNFDIPILERYLGIKINRNKCYDVMSNFVKYFTKGINNGKIRLLEACEDLNIEYHEVHNSYFDCLAILKLYYKIITEKENKKRSIFDKNMYAYKLNFRQKLIEKVDEKKIHNYILENKDKFRKNLYSKIKSLCRTRDKFKNTYFYFVKFEKKYKIAGEYLFAINVNKKIAKEIFNKEIEFRNNEKNFLALSYKQLCSHFLYKYGTVKEDYFLDEFCEMKNKYIIKEHLYIHHIKENEYPNLSKPLSAKLFPFECQKAKNLVYCNLLEHLLLHISIVKETNGKRGYNGMQLIYKDLKNFYSNGISFDNKNCFRYSNIRDLQKDFKVTEREYFKTLKLLDKNKII